ncbi:MAG: hypothetical protein KDA41_01730 [Planctomycetales bacterium]|nr:hypothetical protein [Planctomycetales bacterium]
MRCPWGSSPRLAGWAVIVVVACLHGASVFARAADLPPVDDPTAAMDVPWTAKLPWRQVVDVTAMDGRDWAEKLEKAQAKVQEAGGGVVYFPPGLYRFDEHVLIKNGVVLRGADPDRDKDARRNGYALQTRFEFPRYVPKLTGDGAPITSAFKGIRLADPGQGGGCGIVNIDVNRGHIHFGESEDHGCAAGRLVFGCILRNAAVADPAVPNLKFQHQWQRFTARHHAAIDVAAAADLLVANNRLPRSGDDNFSMDGYLVDAGRGKQEALDGVVFDYDNRPGMYVNHYCIGGAGGSGDDGTPQTHPWGFRRGIVIRNNYIYNTGRMAIGFAGDGVICSGNVIRFAKDVWRPTATGVAKTHGSSTNDNRAIEMRGWRWIVDGNDYEVHRNWAADRKYLINDGEGLMHEDHCNSDIRDSRLTNNKGNAYLSIYKCGVIDGLTVEGNDIRVGGGAAIMVVSNRNSGSAPCRNVTIAGNVTAGGGIVIAGAPASGNAVENNRHVGAQGNALRNEASARLSGNQGYELVKE